MQSLLGDYLLQRLYEDQDGTLYSRLVRCLRTAIITGILRPQSRLPASRDLAQEIRVSRNTVLNVYEQLQAEGYLEARTGRGTWVTEHLPESYLTITTNQQRIDIRADKKKFKLSSRGGTLINHASASPNQWGAFVPGTPDVTEFPHALFNRILSRINREPDVDYLIYSNAGGCYELRCALANYLRIARSIHCEVDQVIITEGIHQAIDLVSRTLSDHGDHAWIEDPGYWGVRNTLRVNGVVVEPMPVDAEGIIPHLDAKKTPKLIFVTPSHQYPLGSHLSLNRRRQLLDFARRHNSWIVEDDYDSEFRFSGQPYPALQGLEADAPVIYMGTFSKTIFPAMRLGYLVVPKMLFSPMRIAAAELYRGGHLLMQKAVAEFITEGHYEAHIRRMRLLYLKRRKLLIELIYRYLGPEFLHEYDEEAGLHLVLKLPSDCDDVGIASKALDRQIYVRPLSQYYMTHHDQAPRGLLLGFACVAEKNMTMAFGVLLQCLRDYGVATR